MGTPIRWSWAVAGLVILGVTNADELAMTDQREAERLEQHRQRNLRPIVEAAEQFAAEAGLPGAAVLVMDASGEVLLEHYLGGWDERTTVPVASASKWWAAATLMSLVDDGLVALDDSVADYLPEFRNRGAKSRITVRDTLRFTAGYASHIAMQDDPSVSQADLVRHLAEDVELLREPGTAFHYGGLQMEIAGRIAEVVTGKPYVQVFEERIVAPLALRDTRLANLRNRRPNDLVFNTANPLVPGGIVTSVRDYRVFLEMLLNGGVYRDTRVLSEAAIGEMLRDQTAELPIAYSIQQDDSYHYALGGWYRVHPASGEVVISSSGALGTAPWINPQRGYAAMFLTRGRAGQSAAFIWRFMDLVTDVMRGAEVESTEAAAAPSAPRSRPSGNRGAAGGSLFDRLDRNGDGVVERDEIPARATRLLEAFDRNDKDGDGRLTREEFRGAGGGGGTPRYRGTGAADDAGRDAPPPAGTVTAAEPSGQRSPGSRRNGQDDAREPTPVSVVEHLELEDQARNKRLPIRVLYPDADGSYPLIVFSHFAGGTRQHYDPMVRHWAAHGYVVMLPDHADSPEVGGKRGRAAAEADWLDRPRDITFALDALDQVTAAVPALRGRIDDSRIGVGGHALGALTANLISGMRLSGAPSLRDERVDAVLLMAPPGIGEGITEHSWRDVAIPSLTVVGSEQVSNRAGKAAEWRNASFRCAPPGDRYLLFVDGMGAGNAGLIAGPGGSERGDPTHATLLNTVMLAYWDACLAQDPAAQARLTQSTVAAITGGAARLSIR